MKTLFEGLGLVIGAAVVLTTFVALLYAVGRHFVNLYDDENH